MANTEAFLRFLRESGQAELERYLQNKLGREGLDFLIQEALNNNELENAMIQTDTEMWDAFRNAIDSFRLTLGQA